MTPHMKRFQRTVEDFSCEHCGTEVRGDGYTNHCPQCLWSKHTDIFPGDRAAGCGGLMEPYTVEIQKGEYTIHHRCTRCRHQRRNKKQRMDSYDRLIELTAER